MQLFQNELASVKERRTEWDWSGGEEGKGSKQQKNQDGDTVSIHNFARTSSQLLNNIFVNLVNYFSLKFRKFYTLII